jgi:phosphatidate phosphatase APP1
MSASPATSVDTLRQFMDGVKFPEIVVPEFLRRHHLAQDAAYKSGKRYVPGVFLLPAT